MKKNLLKTVTTLLFFSSISFAQPVLTAIGINPVPGDAFTMNECNYISPGSGGINQTWDLSSLVTNTTSSLSYSTVASSPYAASFSSIANLSCYYGYGGYFYFNTSSTAFQNMGNGYAGPPACTEILPNPEDRLRFPLNFNDSYTDFSQASNCTNTSGTLTITYDGYGTLILPTGTFTDAIRIHYVQHDIGSIPFIHSDSRDIYYWYINGCHNPIAAVSTKTLHSTFIQSSSYLPIIPTDVDEIKSHQLRVELYPNPVNDKINFSLDNITLLNQIDIYDVTGKLCYSAFVDLNELINNTYSVNVENFKNGMYFSKLTMKNGSIITKKFTVFTGS